MITITPLINFFKMHYEHIPFLSSATSCFKFLNCYLERETFDFSKKRHYISLGEGKLARNLVLMAPILGNLTIWIYDEQKKVDRLLSIKAVEADGLSLQYCSKENRNCKEIVRKAVKQNKKALQFASGAIKNDPVFLKELLTEGWEVFAFAGDSIRVNEDFILSFVTKNECSILEYVPDSLLEKKSFLEKAMRIHSATLKSAAFYRDNEDFMFKKCLKEPSLFSCASKRLRKDHAFIEKLVKIDAFFLNFVKEEIKEDENFMEKLLKVNRGVMSDPKKASDKAFIRKLVKKEPALFELASEQLRSDPLFIQEFEEEGFKILQFASDELRKDFEFNKSLIGLGLSLEWVHEDFKKLAAFVIHFVKAGSKCEQLSFADKELLECKKFAKDCFEINPKSLEYFSKEVNRDLILDLLEINANAFYLVKGELLNDRDFHLEAMKRNKETILYMSQNWKDNRPFIREVLKNDPSAYQDMDLFILLRHVTTCWYRKVMGYTDSS